MEPTLRRWIRGQDFRQQQHSDSRRLLAAVRSTEWSAEGHQWTAGSRLPADPDLPWTKHHRAMPGYRRRRSEHRVPNWRKWKQRSHTADYGAKQHSSYPWQCSDCECQSEIHSANLPDGSELCAGTQSRVRPHDPTSIVE